MCDTIIEFARPLYEGSDHGDARRLAIDVAMLAWNIALFPEEKRDAAIAQATPDWLVESEAMPMKWRNALLYLVDRKQAHFARDRRVIMTCDIWEEGDDWNVRLIWVDADGSAQEDVRRRVGEA